MMTYYSQAGQDKWVHDIIGDRGVFVEVGAYDGIQTSNTYALEKAGWTGLCIEAEFGAFIRCEANRTCHTVHKAVSNYKGVVGFAGDRIGGESNLVQCDYLDRILEEYGIPYDFEYLSMDIEGHELTVFQSFNFERYRPKLMTVEHNLYMDGPKNKDAIFELLTRNRYIRVREDAPCLDTNPAWYMKPYEDWYCSLEFYNTQEFKGYRNQFGGL